MRTVHVVVPDGIDDPARPSGGNVYDVRVCRGLAASGWSVGLHAVPGSWPRPDAAAYAALAGAVQRIPDGAVVLLDGLVASTAPEVLVPQASRLRLVALVHMPLGESAPRADVRRREADVLSAAAAVVATSRWAERRLRELYGLPRERLHVAEPGADASEVAAGTAAAGGLLTVGAVIPGKGHDVLVDALRTMPALPWRCVCVGSLERDPAFAAELRRRVADGGLGGRLSFPGPRTGAALAASYAASDLLVVASRAETYGMVVTEALARGLPVVAADVGGVPDALGHGRDGIRPGLLVPPADAAALAAALRSWMCDAGLRRRLRRAALERRRSLSRWPATTAALAGVLEGAVR
jgi:glycosyltransferase involved in cell wall biosynthesis